MADSRPESVDLAFGDIETGQTAEFTREVTTRDLELFTELTGDYHPLHHDEEYARNTRFGGCIVQGLLTASFISRLIGMHLPGKRALYLSQEMKYLKPVRVGDTLTVRGTVIEKKQRKHGTVTIRTDIYNDKRVLVLAGTAEVMIRGDDF